MGREEDGIFSTLRNAALIQQTGGGNGFSFSNLREKGSRVGSSEGVASGPVGFMQVYDKAFGVIAQGGCLLPQTIVYTERGMLQLDEIIPYSLPSNQWSEHDLVVFTDDGAKNSPRCFNNGVAPCLQITTEDGYSISGTVDHKIKRFNSSTGIIEWTKLGDVTAGDYLVLVLDAHQGLSNIALQSPDISHCHARAVVPEKFPAVLDVDLAFFLGYLTGNGFMSGTEKKYEIGICIPHSNQYMIDYVPSLIEQLFGDNMPIGTFQTPGVKCLSYIIRNKAITEFLNINGFAKTKSINARIPRLVRMADRSVLASFLRGLFEADGTVCNGYPCLSTASSRLASDVQLALTGLGCITRIGSYINKAQHTEYRVTVRSSRGLTAWKNNVGVPSPQSRFMTCMEWEPQTKDYTDIVPGATHWLIDHRKHPDRRVRYRVSNYFTKGSQLARSELVRLGLNDVVEKIGNQFFAKVGAVKDIGEQPTLDLEVYDTHTYLANGFVTHNSRRGANMGVLRVDHPDIREFVSCKTSEQSVVNFNISVGITDAFMVAVRDDQPFDLVSPHTGRVIETVQARELWEFIVQHAHHNGEPGVLFLDAANRANPAPKVYQLEATNPCGEQYLSNGENCTLGSLNLARFVSADGNGVDWPKFAKYTRLATRFLDNVVAVNGYVPAIPKLREMAMDFRRIGLGFMGLGDLFYRTGIVYGGSSGIQAISDISEAMRYYAMDASIDLAAERGPFRRIKDSIYSSDDLQWRPPATIGSRLDLDWKALEARLRQHGIRNAAQTTIAPTGTIATVAGCWAYGCEPQFALAYTRHVNDHGKDLELQYTSPLFDQALRNLGRDEEFTKMVIERVNDNDGSCQCMVNDGTLPESFRRFVVSGDITPEQHVGMQAAAQRSIDNSISKTCNFPRGATRDDVKRAYMMAWEMGCKGLTIFVTGSRDIVVLESKKEKERKAAAATLETAALNQTMGISDSGESSADEDSPDVVSTSRKSIEELKKIGLRWSEDPSVEKSRQLEDYCHKRKLGEATPSIGFKERLPNDENMFVHFGYDATSGEPVTCFVNGAKAGTEMCAIQQMMGISTALLLSVPSPLSPTERLALLADQLKNMRGPDSKGLGPNKVCSMPDAFAKAAYSMLTAKLDGNLPLAPGNPLFQESKSERIAVRKKASPKKHEPKSRGEADLCPACNNHTLRPVEGCLSCPCGHSRC